MASRVLRGVFALLGLAALALSATQTRWKLVAQKPAGPTTEEIGKLFMGEYLLPFEIASILLLVALIGAAMLVRRRSDA